MKKEEIFNAPIERRWSKSDEIPPISDQYSHQTDEESWDEYHDWD